MRAASLAARPQNTKKLSLATRLTMVSYRESTTTQSSDKRRDVRFNF